MKDNAKMNDSNWYYNETMNELGCFVQGRGAIVTFCVLDSEPGGYAMNRVCDKSPPSVPEGFKPISNLQFVLKSPKLLSTKTSITF